MSELPPFFSEHQAPPAARLLGWRYEGGDAEAGTIEVSFEAREDFLNPAGTIQGGFLAAMLDDTMGPVIVLASHGKSYAPTINLNVNFLKPVLPGRVRVKARIVQMGKTIAYLAGELFDSAGNLAATATASARVIANPIGKG